MNAYITNPPPGPVRMRPRPTIGLPVVYEGLREMFLGHIAGWTFDHISVRLTVPYHDMPRGYVLEADPCRVYFRHAWNRKRQTVFPADWDLSTATVSSALPVPGPGALTFRLS